ncbi:putative leucine-rich repeat-containing protein DDB_G0290503 isoform X2 [Chironomus tepperi]|uniref:putative leucine-rich repeat-containing protein DDB_G0290503 isoform X2 n=1 Tax=Chironomus tepperi TaxID=113505 RepID=UPI00391FABDE
MSHFSLLTEMQSELDALFKRRRSFESDVFDLEKKINVVNQNLQKSTNKAKMMSLLEFLEAEKQRILDNKLNKVNEKTIMIKDKIANIRNSQKNSISMNNMENKSSQLLDNVHLNKIKLSRHKSFQQPTKMYDNPSRKYQSFPTSRPQTAHGFELFTLKSSPQTKESSTHLPMCMSMNVCKECTALRNFFLKMQHEVVEEIHKNSVINNCDDFFIDKSESTYNVSSNSADTKVINNYTFDNSSKNDMHLSTDNANQMQYCMRCKTAINKLNIHSKTSQHEEIIADDIRTSESSVHYLNSHSKGIDGDSKTEISETQPSSNYLDVNSSISASILATCESYAFCECCNYNLSKISMSTPSPSIVELACVSHDNCTKCTKAFSSSRKSSLSLPKSVSHEILLIKPDQSNESLKQINNLKCSKKTLCEEIKKEIEYQNQVIFDTKEQISKLSTLNESDEKLLQLKNMLEIENLKLANMENLAKVEEQKPMKLNSWQKPFIIKKY